MRTKRIIAIVAWGAMLAAHVAAQSAKTAGGTTLPPGRWAQKRGVLDSRLGTVAFIEPCVGNGFVPDPVVLDEAGRFDVEGQFRFNSPVPEAPYFRARYVGQLRGRRMALTIISLDPEHPFVRAYVLRKGAKASFRGCPDEDAVGVAGEAASDARPN
jgi:hypothetical protein